MRQACCTGISLFLKLLVVLIALLATQTSMAQRFDMIDSGQGLGNAHSRDVALADLDGDGDLDAFVANIQFTAPPQNRVWINQGGAQAGSPGTFFDSGQGLGDGQSYAVALGDLDGDGDIDAFVGNSSANRVWLNDGTGTFQADAQQLGANITLDIALADVDDDGDLDAIAANLDSGAPNTLWINQGGFQGGTEGVFVAAGLLGMTQADSVAVGDLDGDGDPDAMLGVSFGTPPANEIWINQGGAQSGTPGVFTDSGQRLGDGATVSVSLGDLDGDGDLDAFAANSGISFIDQVWVNPGPDANGDPGAFQAGWRDPGRRSTDAALADFDGDGDIDQFIARINLSGLTNEVWLNDGAGGFVDSGLALGTNPSMAVAAGDVDGDGDIDAWVANDGFDSGPEPNRVWLGTTNSADVSVSVMPSGQFERQTTTGTVLSASVDIAVSNAGPDAASDNLALVIVSDEVDITSTAMVCSEQNTFDDPRCELQNLGAGQSATAAANMVKPRRTNGIFAGELSLEALLVFGSNEPFIVVDRDFVQFDFYDCSTGCLIENVFCNRQFNRASVNSSKLHSKGSTGEGFVPDLPVYYLVRQMMNYGAPGQRLVQRYADHQAEIMALADSDPALMNELLSALESWQPLLAALVTGDPDSELVTQVRVDALDAFLANLEAVGSQALAQAIAEERAIIGPLNNLVGLTAGQAADTLIPSDVIFGGGFERPETLTE